MDNQAVHVQMESVSGVKGNARECIHTSVNTLSQKGLNGKINILAKNSDFFLAFK